MRYPTLGAGDTVHVKAVVVGIDHSHVQVKLGDASLRQTLHVPRALISAVDLAPDAKLLGVLCGEHGRMPSAA